MCCAYSPSSGSTSWPPSTRPSTGGTGRRAPGQPGHRERGRSQARRKQADAKKPPGKKTAAKKSRKRAA
jgi:hypothetical protein